MSAELEATIPPAGDTPARLSRIEATLANFGSILDEIKRALVGGLDGAPGIYQRLGGHERALKDHEDRIISLEASVKTIEATPGKTAITWADRLGLGLMGLFLSAIGAAIGASLKGGHP